MSYTAEPQINYVESLSEGQNNVSLLQYVLNTETSFQTVYIRKEKNNNRTANGILFGCIVYELTKKEKLYYFTGDKEQDRKS